MAINDPTLQKFDAALPLSYQRQVFILRQILEADPAAIYVDFRMAYEHTDESLTLFQSVLDEAKSKHIPIFFARGEEGHDQIHLLPPLRDVESYSNALETSSAYPLLFEEEDAALKEGEPSQEETRKPEANAAFDVYRSLCTSTWSGQCGSFHEDDFRRPMMIQWGLHVDPAQTQVSSLDNSPRNICAVPFSGGLFCRSIVQSFTLGFRAFWGSSRDYEVGHAYYPLTIGAHQLGERGLGTPAGSPPLSHLLKGARSFTERTSGTSMTTPSFPFWAVFRMSCCMPWHSTISSLTAITISMNPRKWSSVTASISAGQKSASSSCGSFSPDGWRSSSITVTPKSHEVTEPNCGVISAGKAGILCHVPFV